jgi:hypothetical protein
MITRRSLLAAGSTLAGTSLSACANMGPGGGWTTLVDGPNMLNYDAFTEIGEGNWRITGGSLQGLQGKEGFLVTRQSYADFELKAHFWADENANSGIFLRCQDRNKVTAANAYEVNIYDKRPDPSYGTGAIVNVAKVEPMPKAANRWNTFEVTAKGDRLVVVLNGVKTVDVRDAKHSSGPVALQSAAGTIRFEKVQIRAI